ncbi:hypothetical protein GOODEAATRI_009294, partial [Goodea atripinnis]
EFLELTVETDTEQPLPPPKEVARKLRSLAIRTVQSWQTSYGSAYKKLELGYHFLKQVKKVFTKSHAEPQLLRRALSLKKSLEAALHKHEELHIDCKTRVRKVVS